MVSCCSAIFRVFISEIRAWLRCSTSWNVGARRCWSPDAADWVRPQGARLSGAIRRACSTARAWSGVRLAPARSDAARMFGSSCRMAAGTCRTSPSASPAISPGSAESSPDQPGRCTRSVGDSTLRPDVCNASDRVGWAAADHGPGPSDVRQRFSVLVVGPDSRGESKHRRAYGFRHRGEGGDHLSHSASAVPRASCSHVTAVQTPPFAMSESECRLSIPSSHSPIEVNPSGTFAWDIFSVPLGLLRASGTAVSSGV